MDEDYQLALLLQQELNNEAPDVIQDTALEGKHRNFSKKREQKSRSLVDPELEFIDPTPDIHALFLQFDQTFFWNKLRAVEVKWSNRMTSCAGVCVYQGRAGFCSVRLSLPLLKLRPRKDLVETMLHEMIHAYLFVTKNNRDRDGHGPEFHKHMNRINNEAGTRITVYHSFHDEVRLYQQHWWRCNGPCQQKSPFFGMVRRATNRAPGPNDNWWPNHQASCGGTFIKVREPENDKKKNNPGKGGSGKEDIRSFFPGQGSSANKGTSIGYPSNVPSKSGGATKFDIPVNSGSYDFNEKIGKKDTGHPESSRIFPVNNVHGFGSTGNDLTTSVKPVLNPNVNNVFGFGDLKGSESKKPTTSTKPNGKGYVLGGSGKERQPFQKKGGDGFGGLLSNKGSGTFLVPGSAGGVKDMDKSKKGSQNSSGPDNKFFNPPIAVFSGTGHVLGKGSSSSGTKPFFDGVPKEGNPSQKTLISKNGNEEMNATKEPPKRHIPSYFDEPAKKKPSLFSSSDSAIPGSNTDLPHQVPCPVCNKLVFSSIVNSHIDDCIKEPPKSCSNAAEIIVLSDSEDSTSVDDGDVQETAKRVNCPSCNQCISKKQLESHLPLCVSSSFEDDDVALVEPDVHRKAKCPICGEEIPASDMDKHLETCASCSVQDLSQVFEEDFSDEEEDAAVGSPSKQVSESGERLHPCPCCLILIENSKMNKHLDQCLL